ncbi:MAG: matrixin family metalloprotease [Chthoniobacterales bacterium]
MHSKIRLCLLGFATLSCLSASAYVLEGQSWTRDRTVQMQLSLDDGMAPRTPCGSLPCGEDGFTTFNQSAQDALNSWNQILSGYHVQFSWVTHSPVTPANDDDEMSAFFSDMVFDKKFGPGTLAITLLNYRDPVMEETDTIFNVAYEWDSYRGPLKPGVIDFHRVATHEFGHTLGLDHPDQAMPPQTQPAIMDANVSNVDTQQADDIAGVQSIYGTGPAYLSGNSAPVMLNISTRAFVSTGDNVLIGGFIVQGTQPATVVLRALGGSLRASAISPVIEDTTITIYDSSNHQVAFSDDWFTDADAATIASYRLDPPNSIESAVIATLNPGSYTAVVQSFSNTSQAATSGIGLVEIYDLHRTSSRLGNLSTRGQVLTGDNILIGGFIVGPGSNKTVCVRALGPTLGDRGVANSLSDPTLEVRDASGNLIASNDNWQQASNAATIQSEGLGPAHTQESAVQLTVNPGNYTRLVRGVGDATGVALVEVYDLSAAP